MLAILGIICVFAMVFGGYILAGGKMAVIIKALPFELMMIGGAGAGAFMISNKGEVAKGALKGLGGAFGTGKWKAQDYTDLLSLLFGVLKLARTKGMIAIEPHIENPKESAIFSQYPRIIGDHFACDFICDTLRMVGMNLEDPNQIKSMMQSQLDKHHHEAHGPSHAIHMLAEGLPALGIVAAVLGVIKTMGSINEPVEVLGGMIGGALVGTFLGVFLSYGFAGPLAEKMHQVSEGEHQFYLVIRDVFVSHLNGNAPQVAIEVGRGNVPTKYQPSFAELEEILNDVKFEA